jgi:hypothetical protein
VTSIDFCFYDSGEHFIQLNYWFLATIEGPERAANLPYIGYMSAISEPPEALPRLQLPVPQISPTTPGNNRTNIPQLKTRQSSSVTVSRYSIDNSGTVTTYWKRIRMHSGLAWPLLRLETQFNLFIFPDSPKTSTTRAMSSSTKEVKNLTSIASILHFNVACYGLVTKNKAHLIDLIFW